MNTVNALEAQEIEEVAKIEAPAIVIEGLQWFEPNRKQVELRLIRPRRTSVRPLDPIRFWLRP